VPVWRTFSFVFPCEVPPLHHPGVVEAPHRGNSNRRPVSMDTETPAFQTLAPLITSRCVMRPCSTGCGGPTYSSLSSVTASPLINMTTVSFSLCSGCCQKLRVARRMETVRFVTSFRSHRRKLLYRSYKIYNRISSFRFSSFRSSVRSIHQTHN
jgi:hypothetical protein